MSATKGNIAARRVDFDRFVDACNYPGVLHAGTVEQRLLEYLKALGISRHVVQLKKGWRLDEYPSLARYIDDVLADFEKRVLPHRPSADGTAKDAMDAAAARDASDARDVRDALAARAARDAAGARTARAAVAARDARDAMAARAARDAIAASDASDARAALAAMDAVNASDATDARDMSDARDALGTRTARAARDAVDASSARTARDAMVARDASSAKDARAASDARGATAAIDATDARDAVAARTAMDARAGFTPIWRFAAWCIQAYGWWYYRFDLSWIATMHLGAMQLNKPAVDAWAKPLFEAYIAGCWRLHFTDDTLYWIAKPAVHTETANGRRRLHHETHAALESDIEDLYFWHGVLVPAFVVVRPDWITVKHIETEENAEVRRVMIERMGYERYILESGAQLVHSDEIGALYRKELPDDEPLVVVHVVNSTPEPDGSLKRYALRVPPDMRTAREAVAWTFGLSEEEYAPDIET